MITKIVRIVEDFFRDELKKPGEVKGVNFDQNNWIVQIEVPEEIEYMRKRAREDLLALYDVKLDENLRITGFERKYLRQRDSTEIS